MSPLRAGVLGLGQMGRNHVRVLRNLSGIDLVAVGDASGDPESLVPDLPVVATADELVSHNLDLCVIATPTETHCDIGLVMAESGVHTMIEKPIGSDLRSADDLIDQFDRAGVVGCVGHIERYNPGIMEMRQRLAKGELGSIYQVSTRRQGPFVGRVKDVGVIKDLGTHDLDLTVWLTGEPVLEVAAGIAHKMARDHEDLAVITSIMAGGVVGSHLVNWISPFKERIVQVTGERGCFEANSITADLTFWANGEITEGSQATQRAGRVTGGDVICYEVQKKEPLVVELEAFRDAVLGIGSWIVTLREGREALNVAEACLLSASEGRMVAVPTRDEG